MPTCTDFEVAKLNREIVLTIKQGLASDAFEMRPSIFFVGKEVYVLPAVFIGGVSNH
jgi:hypothetical protein